MTESYFHVHASTTTAADLLKTALAGHGGLGAGAPTVIGLGRRDIMVTDRALTRGWDGDWGVCFA